MKKTIIIILDVILLLALILIIPFFIINTFNTLRNTINLGGSLSNEGVVLIQIILLVITFIVLVVLKRIVNKNAVITLSEIIKYRYKKHKVIYSILILFLYVIVIILTLLFKQRMIIYIPNYSEIKNNILLDNENLEQVTIDKYVGWLKNDLDDSPIVIYYGGNGDSSAAVFTNYEELNLSYFKEFNFIMIDYPEYGLSKGSLTETNILEMALLTYNYVNMDLGYDASEIIVMGYSLGSGVASYVASKKAIKKLVLIAPYSSLVDVANTMFPIFYGPFKSLIVDQFNSYLYAKDVLAPTLIIASKKDEVIKFRLSIKLNKSFSNSTLYEYSNLRHNEFILKEGFDSLIKDFILDE